MFDDPKLQIPGHQEQSGFKSQPQTTAAQQPTVMPHTGQSQSGVMPPVFPKTTSVGGGMVRRILISLLILFLLVAIGYGGYIAYTKYFVTETPVKKPIKPVTIPAEEVTKLEFEESVEVNEEVTEPKRFEQKEVESSEYDIKSEGSIEKLPPINDNDVDQDGLSDSLEADFETDPNDADSDDDGLNDFDEITKYFTDPNDEDSDNDTYLDGVEVKNGYNPLGEGKLLTIEGNLMQESYYTADE